MELTKIFPCCCWKKEAKGGQAQLWVAHWVCAASCRAPKKLVGNSLGWCDCSSRAAELQEAMKLLGVQLSSILSLGKKGWGCFCGARNKSSSKQNTLSIPAKNLHCTVSHCGLRSQQGAQFLPWHLVSPLHTCQVGMMRTMLAEPSLLSPPAHSQASGQQVIKEDQLTERTRKKWLVGLFSVHRNFPL